MNQTMAKLLENARKDLKLRQQLLSTREAPDPMEAFCALATEKGYPVTVGELFAMDQEWCDDILIATNGGATYPIEYWNDSYENFLAALNNI